MLSRRLHARDGTPRDRTRRGPRLPFTTPPPWSARAAAAAPRKRKVRGVPDMACVLVLLACVFLQYTAERRAQRRAELRQPHRPEAHTVCVLDAPPPASAAQTAEAYLDEMAACVVVSCVSRASGRAAPGAASTHASVSVSSVSCVRMRFVAPPATQTPFFVR